MTDYIQINGLPRICNKTLVTVDVLIDFFQRFKAIFVMIAKESLLLIDLNFKETYCLLKILQINNGLRKSSSLLSFYYFSEGKYYFCKNCLKHLFVVTLLSHLLNFSAKVPILLVLVGCKVLKFVVCYIHNAWIHFKKSMSCCFW